MRIVLVAAGAALLAGCASGPKRPSRAAIDRMLIGAPGEAQPSKVVAAEIAFARMAKEEGQWTAFRKTAASGAIIHGRNGPIDSASWLKGKSDPAEAVQWAPRAVWMSCDGALAVSQGRFRDPQGLIGNFVTVWQRQKGDEYRWVYDAAAVDNPQPAPRPADSNSPDVDIVVTAINAVEGHVADCETRDADRPEPPVAQIADPVRSQAQTSRDGTLRWRWEHGPQGDRRVIVHYLLDGSWQLALNQSLPIATDQ